MIPAGMRDWLVRKLVSSSEREDYYLTLALMIENGTPLEAVLAQLREIEVEEPKNPLYSVTGLPQPMVAMLSECHAAVSDGASFGDANARWVSPEEGAAVKAGERSGRLADAFASTLKLVQDRGEITSTTIRGSIYPTVLLLALAGLLALVSVRLGPMFKTLLRGQDAEGAMAVLIAMADTTAAYGVIAGLAFVVGLIASLVSLPRWTGRWRMVAESLPSATIFGAIFRIYKDIQGSAFLANMAMLSANGVQRLESLTVLAENASPYMLERIEATIEGIEEGESFGGALDKAGYDFPSRRAVKLLRLVDGAASYDKALSKFADKWMQMTIKKVRTQVATMGYIILIAVGSVGGLLVVALTEMNTITEEISNKYDR